MNTWHQCADCGHVFTNEGQNEPHISPAVQCPQCHSYKTQPAGEPDENNDFMHGTNMGMPDSDQDDMSGNPLREGMLGDWKNFSLRDESFGGGTYSYKISLFETPEFETTEIIAPQDLYQHGLEAEATHRAHIQLPKGITDNLHATLGNLRAWVENPYENGELRPYYNKYWKSIRPSYMKPGSLQIGVADPTMAEIINHVAQTDDLTPLYEYRGHTSATKIAGPLMGLLPEGLGALLGGGAAADAGAGAAIDATDAAASAGANEAAGSVGSAAVAGGAGGLGANQVGGLMKGLIHPSNLLGMGAKWGDDLLGAGQAQSQPNPQVNPVSFYARTASDEDSAFPDSHDEIPKNKDGDHKEQTDGNQHEWQRDISVNDVGGTEHSPSFNPAGPAFQRFLMLLPLVMQYMDSGEDATQDPLIQGLHRSLDSELPGYLDHGDEAAGKHLIMVIKNGIGKPSAEPEKNEETHTDENSGGKHESRVASIQGEVAEFLPSLETILPSLNGFKQAAGPMPMPGGAPMPGGPMGMGTPPGPPTGMPPSAPPGGEPSNQGPVTDEQQAWFSEWLQKQGRESEIPKMLAYPELYAKEFAIARGKSVPPQAPQADGLNDNPPMPAQEEAPPQETMPVPPMGAAGQMMSAVQKYAADSIAGVCPSCGGHTTELLDGEDGTSRCHACNTIFKTDKGVADKVHPGQTTASTHWNVDEDLRKEADVGADFSDADHVDTAPVQGVPIADQQHQRDLRKEQDSGHTWLDEDGNPLKVGQEYEMYSDRFDIPDLVRIEAVKPSSLVFTLVGEYGMEHSTELTKEEANIEGDTFRPTNRDGELGPDDDDSFEQNNDDNTAYTGPGVRDLSQPDSVVSSVIASGVEEENPKLAWLKDFPKTAGQNYTPMEQRTLIEESGIARNSDLLDLVGTHYIADEGEGYEQFAFGW